MADRKHTKYTVVDGGKVIKSFKTKRECRFWLMEGLYFCDGSEMERYRDMLAELDIGKTELNYWSARPGLSAVKAVKTTYDKLDDDDEYYEYDLLRLARLVAEWAASDDALAADGWTAEVESDWHTKKDAMVEFAMHTIENSKR